MMLNQKFNRMVRSPRFILGVTPFLLTGLIQIGCGNSTNSSAAEGPERTAVRSEKKTEQVSETKPSPAEAKDVAELKKLKFDYDTNAEGQVIEIDFKHQKVTKFSLKLVGRFPALEVLNLDKTQLVDADLSSLKGLTKLLVLSLEENAITDKGLEHLKGMKILDVLSLQKTKITEIGRAHV